MALPSNTMDASIYLLAGKILLYYAENPEVRPDLKISLVFGLNLI